MPLIILDRDGVINFDSEHYIRTPEQWIPIPGSLEAIAQLKQAGYKVAIATNQSGIARNYFDYATLEAIHNKMAHALAKWNTYLDGIFICPHHPDANCSCRKPKTGLLLQISEYFAMPLFDVPVIGDSARDIQAAISVGAKPIWVATGKPWQDKPASISHYPDLNQAVSALLKGETA